MITEILQATECPCPGWHYFVESMSNNRPIESSIKSIEQLLHESVRYFSTMDSAMILLIHSTVVQVSESRSVLWMKTQTSVRKTVNNSGRLDQHIQLKNCSDTGEWQWSMLVKFGKVTTNMQAHKTVYANILNITLR